ncbi:MAG: methylmalonyl-CoA epimerase [Planctomycetales bacterium]|nr:methylmalonyl-CoA epimerase [Planctomycetales bacterium]
MSAGSRAPVPGSGEWGVGPLDHIGIAVRSLAEALPFWTQVLGLPAEPPEDLPHMGLRVVKIRVGEARIELLETTRPGTPIAKFVEARGPGLHHVCFRVTDVAWAGRYLASLGHKPLTDEPQVGAGGALVLFLHPRAGHGVLVELSQPAAGRAS